MNTITASQLMRMIDGDEEFTLINVLFEEAFRNEHIPGSINLPVDDKYFARKVQELPDVAGDVNHTIVVYCASQQCTASSTAAQTLELAGFTNVHRFEGGMRQWKAAGYPTESGGVRV
jgi:rhodanese-related sulfurtransferase